MTRTEAISRIQTSLSALADEQVAALADMAGALMKPADREDDTTRAAIIEGLAQADRGEFASDAEVAAAFARFSKS